MVVCFLIRQIADTNIRVRIAQSIHICRILGVEFWEISLSCKLKFLTSHFLPPKPTDFPYSPISASLLVEKTGDFSTVLWLLWGNFGLYFRHSVCYSASGQLFHPCYWLAQKHTLSYAENDSNLPFFFFSSSCS